MQNIGKNTDWSHIAECQWWCAITSLQCSTSPPTNNLHTSYLLCSFF